MVRGRQLDPTMRARIFELRAAGNGAKKIHKYLPDVPFNTIKTTLRRSKTLTPGAGHGLTPTSSSRGLQQPMSDDASPSASPSLDPKLSVAPPLNLAPNPNSIRPIQQQQQLQQQQQQQQQQQPPQQPQQQQQQQQPQQQPAPTQPAYPKDLQRQQQAQQLQQQQHHRTPGGPLSSATSTDSQARAARARASASDLLNEILPPGSLTGGGASGSSNLTAATTANPALDLDRLKTDYRAMTDAQRAAADAELDLRKAALVSVRWEARRELEAARRQAQLEQLQQLQQEGLDAETFYARFRELVTPGQAVNGTAVGVTPGTA
ncbi:hypothetical protein HYQ45_004576 [Verticillium longisporum]|uniref:Uncharacterized protein n=1 Tax=Verticillium longisporum TaxID=100787 RepID=A0A8I2ZUX6_VERLO|nr:hypothetical protein HYQ45_004576 [Verticillium longisporum]